MLRVFVPGDVETKLVFGCATASEIAHCFQMLIIPPLLCRLVALADHL